MSEADEEPLAATASRVDEWLLLEYRGVWAHDAVAGSALGAEVREWLRAFSERRRRVLFVRRGGRRADGGPTAFHVRSAERGAVARRLELDCYDDLLELDPASAGEPLEHPLFLVCTHGKHDPCCAKRGRPLYDALREQVDDGWLWQSTHLGGDRFAGNLVALPHGLYFGRVGAADAWTVVDEALAGRVHLPLYRGRSCYPFALQAAERAVREHAGVAEIDGLRLAGAARTGETSWTATFAAGGAAYEVDVRREDGPLTHLTCKAAELRHPRRFVAGTPRARAA